MQFSKAAVAEVRASGRQAAVAFARVKLVGSALCFSALMKIQSSRRFDSCWFCPPPNNK